MLTALLFLTAIVAGGTWTAMHGARLAIPRAPRGAPVWLRGEGLGTCLAAMLLYDALGGSWNQFVALFLLPDIGMLPYLAGRPALGRITYNITHTHMLGLALGVVAHLLDLRSLLLVSVTWCAHIGLDRMLGFGIKTGPSFANTHLGRW